VIRRSTIVEKNSLSGGTILGLKIDPRFAVDIDTRSDWTRAEWLVTQGNLEMVWPGIIKRPIPEKVDMIVFDFDGVFTDNRVWVDQDGRESIAAYRSDSYILSKVREAGIDMMVISKEVNPVVTARCNKMKLDVRQGIDDKAALLKSILTERQINPSNVIYVGNDLNDVPCFPLVGCAVVVADAIPDASRQADFQLNRPGGHGAVRELCDLVLNRISERS
jgi:N-acylneuraminate cytidylyltransferase